MIEHNQERDSRDIPIQEVDFGTRTRNLLLNGVDTTTGLRVAFVTLGDLANQAENLWKIRRIGRTNLREIQEVFDAYGLKVKVAPIPPQGKPGIPKRSRLQRMQAGFESAPVDATPAPGNLHPIGANLEVSTMLDNILHSNFTYLEQVAELTRQEFREQFNNQLGPKPRRIVNQLATCLEAHGLAFKNPEKELMRAAGAHLTVRNPNIPSDNPLDQQLKEVMYEMFASVGLRLTGGMLPERVVEEMVRRWQVNAPPDKPQQGG